MVFYSTYKNFYIIFNNNLSIILNIKTKQIIVKYFYTIILIKL